jgi:hypothetical protein
MNSRRLTAQCLPFFDRKDSITSAMAGDCCAAAFRSDLCRRWVTLGHSAMLAQCPVCLKADTAGRFMSTHHRLASPVCIIMRLGEKAPILPWLPFSKYSLWSYSWCCSLMPSSFGCGQMSCRGFRFYRAISSTSWRKCPRLFPYCDVDSALSRAHSDPSPLRTLLGR